MCIPTRVPSNPNASDFAQTRISVMASLCALSIVMSWTGILYIFVFLFLTIYWTYFIMRRALAFGARVRGLDHCAMCTAQRLWRAVGLLNCTSTCGARVWIAPRIGRILPPPPHPVSVCTIGCIAHVTYRNWSKTLEYDFVVSRA